MARPRTETHAVKSQFFRKESWRIDNLLSPPIFQSALACLIIILCLRLESYCSDSFLRTMVMLLRHSCAFVNRSFFDSSACNMCMAKYFDVRHSQEFHARSTLLFVPGWSPAWNIPIRFRYVSSEFNLILTHRYSLAPLMTALLPSLLSGKRCYQRMLFEMLDGQAEETGQ